MRLRTQLLLLVLAVWLPAAAGFGLLAWHIYQQEAAAIRQQVEQYGLGIRTLAERELDKRVVLARTLAASNAARDGDFARLHEEARAATRETDNWVVVVDEEWHIAHSLAPFTEQRIRRAKSGPLSQDEPKIVFVPWGPVSQRSVITVFAPIPGASPQKYNVGVSFEPAVFQSYFQKIPEPFNGLAVIVDRQQFIMARSRDPQKWFGVSASPSFKSRILSQGYGFAESTTLDGVPSLTYLSPPNAYGWSVVIAVPTAELSAAAGRASRKGLAAAATLLLFGLAGALYGARKLARTVTSLRDAAAELGRNRIPVPLHTGVQEVDEVGEALRAAGASIQEINSTLEQRVVQAVRQAEEAHAKLLQSQKLELIGRLTAGVAHDFNNLLQSIGTALQLLGRRSIDEPERRLLTGAIRATSKAGDLVRQLMSFGRVQKLEPAAVSLADVVLKSQELTSKAVGERIVLAASLEPGLPDVYVDPVQCEMALLNLVFNARDALPAGGHITVSARRATAQETQAIGPGGFVRLEVEDDGTGMSEETRSRAFEPYFTTKPVGSGSGIGLAQVHSFARQSGGDIVLASALGRGTRVCLFLPVATSPACATAAPAAIVSAQRRLKVLMVEDDTLVASVVAAALEDEGHAVRRCQTADEAAALLRTEEPFDLLFTDVVMPGAMNGIDLVKWCRVHRAQLPTLVTTGYAENLSDVAVTVIRKPYEIDTLLAAIQQATQPVGQAA